MTQAVLKNYKIIIDVDTFDSVLTDDIVNQLYLMNNACFPDLPEKSKEHYYLRLIKFIHNDIKHYRSASSSPKSTGMSSSSSSDNVILQDNLYGKLFRRATVSEDYNKRNRWELFVLFENESLHKVVASSLVHYNDITGLARTKEICVGVPGKKYCKEMLLKVIEEIKKEDTIKEITIFCEKNNPAACKCYDSVFKSKETDEFTKVTETADKRTYLYKIPTAKSNSGNNRSKKRTKK